MRRIALALLALGVFVGAAGAAGAAEPATQCAGIDDDGARLACYDEAFGRRAPAGTGTLAPAAATRATTAGAEAAAAPTRSDKDFGLSAEQRAVDKEPAELIAMVTHVQDHSHVGRWIVTLDNGQVWEQRETTSRTRRPRPGDQVTISKASLGSYLLSAPGRGSSRVKRVR